MSMEVLLLTEKQKAIKLTTCMMEVDDDAGDSTCSTSSQLVELQRAWNDALASAATSSSDSRAATASKVAAVVTLLQACPQHDRWPSVAQLLLLPLQTGGESSVSARWSVLQAVARALPGDVVAALLDSGATLSEHSDHRQALELIEEAAAHSPQPAREAALVLAARCHASAQAHANEQDR